MVGLVQLSCGCVHQRTNSRCHVHPAWLFGWPQEMCRELATHRLTTGKWPCHLRQAAFPRASKVRSRPLSKPSDHTGQGRAPVGWPAGTRSPRWVSCPAFSTPGRRTVCPQRRPGSERRPSRQKVQEGRAMTSQCFLGKEGGFGRGGGPWARQVPRAPAASQPPCAWCPGVDTAQAGPGWPWLSSSSELCTCEATVSGSKE